MGTAPNIQVILKAPTNFMTSQWQYYMDSPAKNINYKECSNIWIPDADSKAKFLCIEPTGITWDSDTLQEFKYGADKSFTIVYNAFGLNDYGISHYAQTANHWYAYSTAVHEADTPAVFYGRCSNLNGAKFDIYPRVDFSKSFTQTGPDSLSRTHYFCPLVVRFNKFKSLDIYEYEYDDMVAFDGGETALVKKAEIPLGGDYAAAIDNYVFWNMCFVPLSRDGVYIYGNINGNFFGEAYYSRIKRENLYLMPRGAAGAQFYNYAGLGNGMVCLGRFNFTAGVDGTVTSELLSKADNDTQYPTVATTGYSPDGTTVTTELVDEDGNTIEDGDSFQEFKYKVTLDGSSDTKRTPIIFNVNVDLSGALDAYVQTGVDVSDDIVSVQESSGVETGDFRTTIKLRNKDGKYNYLLQRVMHEIIYSVNGNSRGVLYTNDLTIDFYATPTQEGLFAEWDCGDGWTKLEQQKCLNMPPLDGLTCKQGLEKTLQYLGWPTSKMAIEDIDFYFPQKRAGIDYCIMPEDGQTAADFIKNLHKEYFSTYIMRFDKDGKFEFKTPDDTVVSRTFYLSKAEAEAKYAIDELYYGYGQVDPNDYIYYTMGPVQIQYIYSEFVNEIWIVGYDETTDYIEMVMGIDIESQFNPYYPYYVGDRRVLIWITNIADSTVLNWIYNQIKLKRGQPRLITSFKTRVDESLRTGDFITIHPYDILFRITSLDISAEPDNVSFSSGAIYGMTVTVQSWPTSPNVLVV